MHYLPGHILCLVLLTSQSVAEISGPTKCELSIVRCCDTEQDRVLPLRCFEVNGCPGLFWYGKKACSSSLVALARFALNRISQDRKKADNPKNADNTEDKFSPVTNTIPDTNKPHLSTSSLPTPCQLTIVRCCDVQQNTVLPLRCFDVNGCPGLYWHGRKACSKSIVTAAISSLNRKSKRRNKQSKGL